MYYWLQFGGRGAIEKIEGVLPDGTLLCSQPAPVSAETVAISLLQRFSDKQLPKASDLQWLVSEQDAPQQVSGAVTSFSVCRASNLIMFLYS